MVVGNNFGTGSSREQAATALKSAGIQLVLAGTFSETFKRNALNNGLLCLECPTLVEKLRKLNSSNGAKTIRIPASIQVDCLAGKVTVLFNDGNKELFSIPIVGTAAQELIALDGLENWISVAYAKIF